MDEIAVQIDKFAKTILITTNQHGFDKAERNLAVLFLFAIVDNINRAINMRQA